MSVIVQWLDHSTLLIYVYIDTHIYILYIIILKKVGHATNELILSFINKKPYLV